MSKKNVLKKAWPKDCPWPEPVEWSFDYDEDTVPDVHDEETEDLLKIKEYFDNLVNEGLLNEDYSLNEDFEDEEMVDEFHPEIGEDYWDEGFNLDVWQEDLSNHINLFQIAPVDFQRDPIITIRDILHYEFVNENLLRQAFTRRSFQLEYGLSASSEELEFLGDTILSTIVTREIFRQFSDLSSINFDAPFRSKYNEGELTKLRESYICKEALASRARELGLGKYILYATSESETDHALEDMMEALIGAVTMDSNWDMESIEKAVNELLFLQFDLPDELLKKSHYDILNVWHQKHFGSVPIYEVYKNSSDGGYPYWCDVRFRVPENNKGIYTSQRLNVGGETRSKARENAAERAHAFVVNNGLWVNLKDAGIVPNLENSINQLQELYQKKYLENKPVYEFEERGNGWYASCVADSFYGSGESKTKVKAKKKASYCVIVRMLMSAGICQEKWESQMYQNMWDME